MPPRKSQSKAPTPVDAITYTDKRANLPTADAREFVAPEIESPWTFRYPRPLHSPQLVWRGKEELDLAEYLEGNAPPIYIQEKIDPRVLIERDRCALCNCRWAVSVLGDGRHPGVSGECGEMR